MHESRPLTNVNISYIDFSLSRSLSLCALCIVNFDKRRRRQQQYMYPLILFDYYSPHLSTIYTDMYKIVGFFPMCCVLSERTTFRNNQVIHEFFISEKAMAYWLSKSTQYDICWTAMGSVSSKWGHTRGIWI